MNKHKYIKMMISIIGIASISFTPVITVSGQIKTELKVDAVLVIDSNLGQILAEQEADQAVEVGALSKSLGLYLISQSVQEGKISLEDQVEISDQAYNLSQDYDLLNVPLRQDFQYSVEELMEAVAVRGANGAMLALAEFHSGSEEKFVKAMENQLKDWKIEDFEIFNATGLPTGLKPQQEESYDKGFVNIMSARACATATYQLIQNYPKILEYSSQTKAVLKPDSDDPYDMSTTNGMLIGQDYEYDGATGFLLGTSAKDGDSAIITCLRYDLPVISVVLGTGKQGDGSRYNQTKKVLDEVYATYVSSHVIKQGQEVTQMGQINIKDGQVDTAKLDYGDSLILATPIIDTAPRLTYEFQADPIYFQDQGFLLAPLEAGTEIGQMVVDVEGQKSKFLEFSKGNRVPVILRESVAESNWFDKTIKGIGKAISDTWEGIRRFFTNLFN